jgi:hypothetical protein
MAKAAPSPRIQAAYEGYAKRTEERALAATRKRHAFRLQATADAPAEANSEGTKFQNEELRRFQNGSDDEDAAIA